MTKRKPKIIRDNKKRGEWAESVFAARAAENGLPVSKPSGDSTSFDYVVGHPGKFVAVQVKCTIAQLPNGKGYRCNLQSNGRLYPPGAFDFVAAYVIPEDAWYIVPIKATGGQSNLSLCTVGTWAKFEKYREACDSGLSGGSSHPVAFRNKSGFHPSEPKPGSTGTPSLNGAPIDEFEERPMGPGVARMQGALNYFRNYLEKGGRTGR